MTTVAVLINDVVQADTRNDPELQDVSGWAVHVHRDLPKQDSEQTKKALELLKRQLDEIVGVVPAEAVAELKEVPLFFSQEYPSTKPRAEYHPNVAWLRANGRDPAMARAVEFSNVRQFEAEMKRMPNFTLHELAHAYHHRVLPEGFENPEIKAAYERAKASGKYDRVERWLGNGRSNTFERAYAMTDAMEYFAEATEAYFSRNDYFPFTRGELQTHDTEMFALLGKLWRTEPAAERDSGPEPATAAARPGGLMADSPVTFPKEGPLPAKYPPDVKDQNEPAEKDFFIFSSPCRSLEQIAAIQRGMPPGQFTAPPADWKHLQRTRRILTKGGELRILALGDSIVNDTMRSGWVALLGEAYPKARIEAMVYVRGGGGCQHFKQEGRVEKYILPRKPDLVLIGGISQADVGSIREVIQQLRPGLPEVEIVLVTGAFGTTDPRDVAALAGAAHSGTGEYGRALQSLAEEERCAYLNLTAPWAEYIRSSGQHPHRFYRDAVHANEFGEQILAQAMLAFFTAKETAFHVSPSGNDAGSGTREQPFATLTKALAATRALPTGQVRQIVVRGGKYWNVSLMLRPEDSGLSLEAEPGETPVLYGGQRLTGWVKDGERCFTAALPALPVTENEIKSGLALPRWEVRLLLVNGQTRPRGRFPETGTLTHQTTFDVPWMSSTGGGWKRKPTGKELTTLRYHAGDLPAGFEVRDAEVTVYHMWDESCVGIAAHDAGSGLLKLTPVTGHPPGAFGIKKFVLWNIREGLTKPGQWYHDRVQNRIVYWPLPDEDLSQAEVVVPTRTQVLRLQGSAGQPIRQVIVRGLTVTATTTPLITGGFAAAAFNGAVSLENAEDCALDQITVRGVAGHGMDAVRNCVRTRVTRSEVADCGAGGIYVGGTGALISHNQIHGVGRAYPSALGIYRGGRECVVRHNEIHDCPYSAINYGGTGNVVEYNLIYDCMKVLHDGAAIYLFAARDCVLRGNVARDIVDTGGYGASAYYLDERSTGCVVEHNLSLRVARPLHNHMATNNVIRHNVFVVEGDAKLTFPRSADFTLAHNLLYATGKIRVEGLNAVTNWTQNLFFSESGKFEAARLQDYSAGSNAEALPEGIILLNSPDGLLPKDQLGAAILRSAGLNPAPPETPDRTPSGENLPLPPR